MPKQSRKRKIIPSSDKMESEQSVFSPPREKIRINSDPAQNELGSILFNNAASADIFADSEAFLENFGEAGPSQPDSGIDSGSAEDSDGPEQRKPAWFDEDDQGIEVGEALDVQGRKLPPGGINEETNKYSDLLKHKFESIVGTPAWAQLDNTKGDESDEDVLHTVGFINKTPKTTLAAGSLEFKKVKDLNCETYTEGPFINSVEFHPTSSVGLVAGNKGIATLFAVDGKKNNKLHSVAFERFPIMCSKFVKNGDEAILGSNRGHMFVYDLTEAKAMRYNLPSGMTQCKKFTVSPDSKYIAVAGKWGDIHVLSAGSKEKIATLKQDSEVTALEFNSNGSLLFGHSDTGEVTIFDLNTRRVKHKFSDEGCLQGSAVAASASNQFLACGSAQGVVNLYGMEDVLQNKLPKPRKSIMNLTTNISGLKFNSSGEILALASTDIKNSVKLFHVASGTVFKNFPPFQSKLGNLNCINFTPGSGFLALGNRKSVVSLFRLKHFKNY